MKQHELKPPKGAKKSRKRLGRGDGSGNGSFSGKGLKGQNSRSGGGVRPGFEGGQNPLIKGLPAARGFTNIFRTVYSIINLQQLALFPPSTELTPKVMRKVGLVKNLNRPIKILGRGEIEVPLVVHAHNFSTSARNKIEAAGGKAEEIGS